MLFAHAPHFPRACRSDLAATQGDAHCAAVFLLSLLAESKEETTTTGVSARTVAQPSHPCARGVRGDVVRLVAERLVRLYRALQVPEHQLHQRRGPALPTKKRSRDVPLSSGVLYLLAAVYCTS